MNAPISRAARFVRAHVAVRRVVTAGLFGLVVAVAGTQQGLDSPAADGLHKPATVTAEAGLWDGLIDFIEGLLPPSDPPEPEEPDPLPQPGDPW